MILGLFTPVSGGHFDRFFQFTFDLFGESEVYPKGLKGFNKYGNTFYYKSIKLGVGFSNEEIVNIVVEYLKHIKTNLSIIKDLISMYTDKAKTSIQT